MKRVLFCLLFSFVSVCVQAEPPSPVADAARKAPPGLEGLVWNKWDTEHFAVLSIDKGQGQSLKDSVESMRADVLDRWGLKGSDSFFCKLACVPDSDMLWKLFGLKEPKCEVRDSEDGKAEMVAIWVDSKRIGTLPSLLAEAEFGSGSYPKFVRHGLPLIERGQPSIGETFKKSASVPLASILEGKGDDPSLHANSALLCLMIRKEYGRRAFGIAASASPSSLHERLGFRSPEELEKTLYRYRSNLIGDIESGRTPGEYLGVRR